MHDVSRSVQRTGLCGAAHRRGVAVLRARPSEVFRFPDRFSDAAQSYADGRGDHRAGRGHIDRHRRLYPRSEEHTSELESLMRISYAVFCLKKKTKIL